MKPEQNKFISTKLLIDGMGKKRYVDFARSGQVTIFIIVGIIILFAFIFILLLSAGVQKAGFAEAQETAFSNIFKKEALRIYVEDCLDDSITSGLQLLGEQGRIWADQGGSKQFSGNGVMYGEIPVAYGIWYKEIDSEFPERYPCNPGTGDDPAFCMYESGNPISGFGTVRLSPELWNNDLAKYLDQSVPKCVENELIKESARNIKLSSEGASFTTQIQDAGVNIDVRYPLRVGEGEVELFELSTFSFLYPTKLKSLLDVAILEPLELDWQKLDFPLKEEMLKNDCEDPGVSGCQYQRSTMRYKSMGVEVSELRDILGDGTDFFEFRPAWNDVKLPEYVFRYARQNRPPVLEYVNQCPKLDGSEEEYDWLIVNGVGRLSGFTPELSYEDPDEDDVQETIGSPVQGVDILTLVKITDDHDAFDLQNVRVHREEKIEPQIIVINLPAAKHPTTNSDVVSLEDPIEIVITNPLVSINRNLFTGGYTFTINGQEVQVDGNGVLCLGRDSSQTGACALSTYDIKTIQENLADLQLKTQGFTIGANGVEISYGDADVCKYQSEVSKKVVVTDCTYIPSDDEYKYPYIQVRGLERLEEFYQLKKNRELDTLRDPFEANNLCCTADGTFETDPSNYCFKERGCFENEYYLEELRTIQCSGNRGNVCDGPTTVTYPNPGEDTCGTRNILGCAKDIFTNCEEEIAWEITTDSSGWCYSEQDTGFGCDAFCDEEIVYVGSGFNKATTYNPSEDSKEKFACGCANNGKNYPNKPCDSNFDGKFGGTCQSNRCSGDPAS
jgi:hypothetical protein